MDSNFVFGIGFGVRIYFQRRVYKTQGSHCRELVRALPQLRRVVAAAPGVVGRPAQLLLLRVVGRRVGDPGAAVPARLLPAASVLLLDHRVVLLEEER